MAISATYIAFFNFILHFFNGAILSISGPYMKKFCFPVPVIELQNYRILLAAIYARMAFFIPPCVVPNLFTPL